ncbi:hypothetical protein NDU88_001344 [Pleurodeles waltl]|uniref:Uncharacterized protein n=1 Tax=Pleurodeles waltl TaxID=8319 RepID=A0AAV7M7Y4_PLEWA|nr:hypothetical protein NDU88_001344 [Pleurodeles waltl]
MCSTAPGPPSGGKNLEGLRPYYLQGPPSHSDPPKCKRDDTRGIDADAFAHLKRAFMARCLPVDHDVTPGPSGTQALLTYLTPDSPATDTDTHSSDVIRDRDRLHAPGTHSPIPFHRTHGRRPHLVHFRYAGSGPPLAPTLSGMDPGRQGSKLHCRAAT